MSNKIKIGLIASVFVFGVSVVCMRFVGVVVVFGLLFCVVGLMVW